MRFLIESLIAKLSIPFCSTFSPLSKIQNFTCARRYHHCSPVVNNKSAKLRGCVGMWMRGTWMRRLEKKMCGLK